MLHITGLNQYYGESHILRDVNLEVKAGSCACLMIRIPRSQYAELYGPTTGDRIRLADTELWIEIERDHTVYGDEVCFGGGKVIRDGMGQSQISNADGAMDTVITNAVIMLRLPDQSV